MTGKQPSKPFLVAVKEVLGALACLGISEEAKFSDNEWKTAAGIFSLSYTTNMRQENIFRENPAEDMSKEQLAQLMGNSQQREAS